MKIKIGDMFTPTVNKPVTLCTFPDKDNNYITFRKRYIKLFGDIVIVKPGEYVMVLGFKQVIDLDLFYYILFYKEKTFNIKKEDFHFKLRDHSLKRIKDNISIAG